MENHPKILEEPYKFMKNKHTIINIGRQFGSGGRDIAQAIGLKLGIPVYDNELIIKAAEQSGFSPELFRKSDEKRRFMWLGSIFGSNRYGSFTSGLNDGELFKIQSDVIRKIAGQGPAIFIGRASNYILRDFDCLNVFICAPMDIRKKYVCGREDLPEDKAEEIIFKRDRARAEFYNFFSFGHWGKSSDYHLCIDSSKLGIEKTADFIIDFGREAGLIR